MEEKILKLFSYNHKLKFNEIEKALKIRSNKLDYHLKKLILKEILTKKKDYYHLSDSCEYLLPYLSDKRHVLPVILIHIGDNKDAFLIERKKRPYYGKISLPGGRLLLGESISDAVKRIMWTKFKIRSKIKTINSISLENVKNIKETIHSYLLIYVHAKADVLLTNVKKNKKRIIESDYKLITTHYKKRTEIKTIDSKV